jgi:hypothetical protein
VKLSFSVCVGLIFLMFNQSHCHRLKVGKRRNLNTEKLNDGLGLCLSCARRVELIFLSRGKKMCNPGNENCYRIHLYIQERRKPNGEYSVFSIAHYRVDYYLLGYNNDNNDNNNESP